MIKIDLFKLHDHKLDDSLKKCVMAKGPLLKETLAPLMPNLNKIQLVKELMKRLNISIASAERLVYLKKEWYPLIFIEELLKITDNTYLKYQIQEKIEFLKANQPPLKPYKAVKELNINLCKIAGAHAADGTLTSDNLIRITDYYEKNIDALKQWVDSEFNINYKKIKIKHSSQEYALEFRSKIIARYLNRILDFPSGCKQYTVKEPGIIKNAPLKFRKAFALGALTFEAGIGIKNQIEFCVASKAFRNSISNILTASNIKHKKMLNQSANYWRLWSNKLTKDEAKKWLELFEPKTEKWLILKNYIDDFQKKVNSFNEAISIFDSMYPPKPNNKVCLKDILTALKELKETHRYELANYLCKKNNLKSFGGTWAHSLSHYLKILEKANIIFVKKQRFGPKKSWGTIVREVYHFNPKIKDWRLPELN